MAVTNRQPTPRRRSSNSRRPYHRDSVRHAGQRRQLNREDRARLGFWIRQHWRYGRLTPGLAKVGLAVLTFVGPDGRCDPSYETIAMRAGVKLDTVWRGIRRLRELRVLAWDRRVVLRADGREHQTSNAYAFVITIQGTFPLVPADYRSPLFKPGNHFTLTPPAPVTKAHPELEAALASLGRAIQQREDEAK